MNRRSHNGMSATGALALASTLLLFLWPAATAEAAASPVGKTYYTVLLGLAEPYDMSASCFEFGLNALCSTDGDTCGSWVMTDSRGRQGAFDFDLALLEDGVPVRIQGEGRLERQGKRSSIGGTGRIAGAGPMFNYSFAGREVKKGRCLEMLGEGPAGDDNVVVHGNGIVASQSRSVSDFSQVALSGVGRLVIRHTGSESLTVRADSNLLEYMLSEVRNGVLVLGNDPGVNFRTSNEIVYELTVRDLDALTVTGVTAVDVKGVDTDLFTVEVSGVAIIKAKGRADSQRVTVSGVAMYDASDLRSRAVTIDVEGVSSAIVRVSEHLSGSVRGVSSLEYIGNPTVDVQVDRTCTLRRIG